MRIRVLVADQSEACLFDLDPGRSLNPVGRLTDPLAHLRDRDLVSDRPGRKYDRAPLRSGRRAATAHHSTGGEHSARRHEAAEFARRIAAELERTHRRGEFEGLILMSGPPFLGLLREALPESIRATLVSEVTKDLVHQGIDSIIEHLPPLSKATQPKAH
jgi:protein required for attachment to host cells